jgi:6-phosphofructokinase 1
MKQSLPSLEIDILGQRTVASPLGLDTTPGNDLPDFVDDNERILLNPRISSVAWHQERGKVLPSFEIAGPRERLFFDPRSARVAIVTCGGLCPGLNNVIRSIVMQLVRRYGVRQILGVRYGLQGFIARYGHPLIDLTPELVESIHLEGGTVLGSSRGPQPTAKIIDFLKQNRIDILFIIGGDGSFRAAHQISRTALEQGMMLSVIGVPKTIDNDISFVERTFGFETAVSVASEAIRAAHVEAKGAPRGLGLVKLMGRHSGFIAASASLAARVADLVLVPEVDFDLEGPRGVFEMIERGLERDGHFVVVLAEGAGQNLAGAPGDSDASGNLVLGDIGQFLVKAVRGHFDRVRKPVNLKYIDPSYIIRAAPTTADDSIFCGVLGEHAVHAALTGKTDMAVGIWGGHFTHVPLGATISARKVIDLEGALWSAVLESTGQPHVLCGRAECSDGEKA